MGLRVLEGFFCSIRVDTDELVKDMIKVQGSNDIFGFDDEDVGLGD
ncbi:hypothetical protein V7266_03580 [Neobacillus drentensis]